MMTSDDSLDCLPHQVLSLSSSLAMMTSDDSLDCLPHQVLSLSSSLGPALAAAAHHGALPTGLSFLNEGGAHEGSLMRQPARLPSWATSGAMGAVSAQYDAASQLAGAAARLSTCAAHLSGLAAKAAMVPIHSTYAQLSEEIRRYFPMMTSDDSLDCLPHQLSEEIRRYVARCHAHLACEVLMRGALWFHRYEARCNAHLAKHAPVHSAAISKVRTLMTSDDL